MTLELLGMTWKVSIPTAVISGESDDPFGMRG
jgi:hypothetical protein